MKPLSTRALAAQVLTHVLQGESLTEALARIKLDDTREQGLLAHLCYGSLRFYPQLAFILKRLLKKPIKHTETEVEALLLLGLFQHLHTRIPPHAATGETVAAARELNKTWATGLINGVLRQFQRQRDNLLQQVEQNKVAHYAHPTWMLKKLQQDWPDDWQAIATANNQQAPMTLRVNVQKCSRGAYLAELDKVGLQGVATLFSPVGVSLRKPCSVSELPGFGAGLVSVQDEAAQLAAGLLDTQAGMRVLDACAAPGGKTAHILETTPDAQVTALDVSAERLSQVEENLNRLGLQAKLHCAAGENLANWWDKHVFDRILLDAPCSASGVIRRHPDIKVLRRANDIAALMQQQFALLDILWQTLAPGGLLLYATCSVFADENQQQLIRFLDNHKADVLSMATSWGMPVSLGRQILPGDMDGFYYACIRKPD